MLVYQRSQTSSIAWVWHLHQREEGLDSDGFYASGDREEVPLTGICRQAVPIAIDELKIT